MACNRPLGGFRVADLYQNTLEVESSMSNRVRWCPGALGLAVGLSWLLTACYSPSPPTPVSTPTCYPRPEPTGEKIIGPTVAAPPPAQVSPGQVIAIAFSGNYIIVNYAIVCGDTIVRHAHGDEFPSFNWDRTVEVLLDEHTLTTVACGYTCQAEVTIPQDILPGAHKLMLETNWESIIFVLQVIRS